MAGCPEGGIFKMVKYVVEVTEILQKEVVVKADSYEQAKRIVEGMYDNEEIILNENDYINTDVTVSKAI